MAGGEGLEVVDDGAVALGTSTAVGRCGRSTDSDPRPPVPAALTGQPGARAPPPTGHPPPPPALDSGPIRPQVGAAGGRRRAGWPGPRPAPRCRWTPTASAWRSPPGRGGRTRHRVRGALLVRPDGLVAWRSIGPPPTHHPAGGVRRAVVRAPASVPRPRRRCASFREVFALVQAPRGVGAACCAHQPATGSHATGGATSERATSRYRGHRWRPAAGLGEPAAAQCAAGPARRGRPAARSNNP